MMSSAHSPYKAVTCDSQNPSDWEALEQAISDSSQAQKLAVMGLYDVAEPLHLRAIAAKERIAGCSAVSIAISYNGLGSMYTRMGRLDEAKSYLEKALRIREENQDCAELDAAVTRMYLAKVLEMQGNLVGAKELRKLGWPKKMLCGNEGCPQCEMFRSDFSLCSKCKSIYYCGKSCQKHDWQRHKKYCQRKERAD